MVAGTSKTSAIEEIFSGIQDLRKEPWKSLWIARLIQYFFFFDVIAIGGGLLFWWLNLFPTDIENARYFLSAMVQAQAAIVTLVITLTLIAIQMASASYTPRVVDVMKRNPDMWYLLIIYLGAMSYGFIALKLVAEPDQFLVSSVLILGVYTFCILFLYMKNTIKLLRPDYVVEMLVNEISVENIHQEGWKKESEDDIMQPVFDVVHASIMRFDVTTTRTGLNALSEWVLELFLAFDEKNREKKAEDIAEHFCKHIQRSALVAFRNDDEGILGEIIDVLKLFGTRAADMGLGGATRRVANALGDVGILAADKGLKGATWRVTETRRGVVILAADKGLKGATWRVADALGEVGIRAADKGLEDATWSVTGALGEVGTHAADKGLEDVTWGVADALREVGIHAADKGLDLATRRVANALGELGTHATDSGMKGATWSVADALRYVGTHAADKGLGATRWVADAVRDVGIRAADRELEYATERVVHALCRLGLKESGQNAAAESLAQLRFRYKSTITESITKFESGLKPEQKDQLTSFMKKVDEELYKLASSPQPP